MEQEVKNVASELRSAAYSTYSDLFSKMRSLESQYGNMPMGSLISAFGRAGGGLFRGYTNNPYIQNNRVKAISTLPGKRTKNEVAEMIKNPNSNEQNLRSVSHGLEFTAYPLFHTRKTYQELLTYHNYVAPHLTDKEDAKRDDFWREYKLLEKLRTTFNPKALAHQAAGQVGQEGKVFYLWRMDVDKSHNKVNHAFWQQLPSDWVKIVGFNNKSKYTVAMNMMYFTKPGTTPAQFGDLFDPYLEDFYSVITPPPKGVGTKIVFAKKTGINLSKARNYRWNTEEPEIYSQNGKWFYWVTLPVDRVFTFEMDDASTTVVPPFTGLFIDMIQLSELEAIQLSLLQNPLVSILTGEIPYWSDKNNNDADQYKLSEAGRQLFQAFWYEMLAENNTNGIGFYAAPLSNMRLESLSEAPSAMDIVSKGYSDTMSKAGLTAIIPVSDDARAGAAQISLSIESKFMEQIYTCMERMFNCMIESLNLRYEWRFRMFGNLATDKDMMENARKDMTLGILPAAIIYNALCDRSILDDMAWSDAIAESGLLDRRMPLVTSYSAKSPDSGLPPDAVRDFNPGGRPSSDGQATSDGNEGDIDSPTIEV